MISTRQRRADESAGIAGVAGAALGLAGASPLTTANVGLAAALLLLMYHGWPAGRAAHLAGRSLMAATSVQEPIESSGLANTVRRIRRLHRLGLFGPADTSTKRPPAQEFIRPWVTTGPDVSGQD